MSGERKHIEIPIRKPSEGTRDYRERISKMVGGIRDTHRPKQTPDEAINSWRENASDLVIQSYFGWRLEEGEKRNDSQGMNINHGSSVPDAAIANGLLERAFNLTLGKPISTDAFIREVKKIINTFEANNFPLFAKNKFFERVTEKAIELRGLAEKGEKLRSN